MDHRIAEVIAEMEVEARVRSVLEGELKARFPDRMPGSDELEAAIVEIMARHCPREYPHLRVERDPSDPTRLVVTGLPEWMLPD